MDINNIKIASNNGVIVSIIHNDNELLLSYPIEHMEHTYDIHGVCIPNRSDKTVVVDEDGISINYYNYSLITYLSKTGGIRKNIVTVVTCVKLDSSTDKLINYDGEIVFNNVKIVSVSDDKVVVEVILPKK